LMLHILVLEFASNLLAPGLVAKSLLQLVASNY